MTLATAPSAAADFSPAAVSLRGLDWVNFFLAGTLGGFGHYVAVYLADQKWTQEEVGFVLSASAFAGLLSQVPGGDGCYPLEAGDPGTGCDISLGRRAYVACVCFSSSHPCNRHSLLRSPLTSRARATYESRPHEPLEEPRFARSCPLPVLVSARQRVNVTVYRRVPDISGRRSFVPHRIGI